MEGDKYILDAEGNPVFEPNLMTWSAWFENADLTIERTHIGEAEVVTAFLGRDHAHGDGAPVLYETTVFNVPHDWEPVRHGTLTEAREAHAAMVERVRKRLPSRAPRIAPLQKPRLLSAREIEAMAGETGHGPTILSLIATARHLADTLKQIAERRFQPADDADERDQMVSVARRALHGDADTKA
ncbi:MAG: hypothetical protein JXB13_11135 [Phycisphaerae bacterium]|nr:hypothetical protein [Phycisphaerae bacterium]